MIKQPYDLKHDQIYAIWKIKDMFEKNINPVCALPPGAGKTIVACSLIKALVEKGKTGFLIIVRANNLRDPWIHELEEFSIPYSLIHGADRKDWRLNGGYASRKSGVILTSHKTAVTDMDYFIKMEPVSLLIIDEIHSFNNPKQLTNSTVQLSRLKAEKKLFLTATPIQNSRDDLGLLNILLNKPGLIGNTASHIDRELLASNYQDAVENGILILPGALRLTDRPPDLTAIKTSKTILSVPLSKEMEDYIAGKQDFFFKKNKKNDLSPKKNLFQYLSHPGAIYKNNTDIPATQECAKTEAVLSIISGIPKDDKVIIFSQYKDVLYRYSELLKEKGCAPMTLTGEDRSGQNEKLRIFKETDIYRVLLTTLSKSAEGLNLREANHVIILEFWWNPQKIFQAMGRIIRKNQEKNVFVYLLCYNKDGAVYEYEAPFLETMKKKITEAKEIMPANTDLPDIAVFSDRNTYLEKLNGFLASFQNPKKKIKIKKKARTSSGIKNGDEEIKRVENNYTENEGQNNIKRPEDSINNIIQFLLAKQSSDLDLQRFKDLDLTGPAEAKPR